MSFELKSVLVTGLCSFGGQIVGAAGRISGVVDVATGIISVVFVADGFDATDGIISVVGVVVGFDATDGIIIFVGVVGVVDAADIIKDGLLGVTG